MKSQRITTEFEGRKEGREEEESSQGSWCLFLGGGGVI